MARIDKSEVTRGIFYRGSDVECQLLYVMGDMEADIRTHHIHIVKWNWTEWKNYIHFWEYLNVNENVVLQYENLKEEMESKRALLEMLVKIRWKIRCGIGAEEGDFCNFDY